RWETWAKVSDALGMKRADFVKNIPEAIRQFLRRDLTNKIPEIPEAWWWIYFWRLTWNFHFEPDPWFESKWWAWMEVRGKQECLNMTGCQNSGKSMWAATFPLVQLIVWEQDCKSYLSGPYK